MLHELVLLIKNMICYFAKHNCCFPSLYHCCDSVVLNWIKRETQMHRFFFNTKLEPFCDCSCCSILTIKHIVQSLGLKIIILYASGTESQITGENHQQHWHSVLVRLRSLELNTKYQQKMMLCSYELLERTASQLLVQHHLLVQSLFWSVVQILSKHKPSKLTTQRFSSWTKIVVVAFIKWVSIVSEEKKQYEVNRLVYGS